MLKMIIVEDEHLIRKWLNYAINYEELGIIIVGEANDGLAGEKLILELEPDIVLTDINMPKQNAFEMFEATKSVSYKKIILSGYGDFPNAKQAIHYGVKEFLSKPLDEKELLNCLAEVVKEISGEKDHITYFQQFDLLKDLRSTSDAVVNRVLEWIQCNYQNKVVAADIAKNLGYSESYIYKKVKDHLGITINEYLNKYRIKMAVKLLLEQPDMLVYEIAEATGFADYKYFNKVFQKLTGMKPSEFRENIL